MLLLAVQVHAQAGFSIPFSDDNGTQINSSLSTGNNAGTWNFGGIAIQNGNLNIGNTPHYKQGSINNAQVFRTYTLGTPMTGPSNFTVNISEYDLGNENSVAIPGRGLQFIVKDSSDSGVAIGILNGVGNGQYDVGEPFTDSNGNGTWDDVIITDSPEAVSAQNKLTDVQALYDAAVALNPDIANFYNAIQVASDELEAARIVRENANEALYLNDYSGAEDALYIAQVVYNNAGQIVYNDWAPNNNFDNLTLAEFLEILESDPQFWYTGSQYTSALTALNNAQNTYDAAAAAQTGLLATRSDAIDEYNAKNVIYLAAIADSENSDVTDADLAAQLYSAEIDFALYTSPGESFTDLSGSVNVVGQSWQTDSGTWTSEPISASSSSPILLQVLNDDTVGGVGSVLRFSTNNGSSWINTMVDGLVLSEISSIQLLTKNPDGGSWGSGLAGGSPGDYAMIDSIELAAGIPEAEPEPEPTPEGKIEFTFIGTNNHDFSSFVTVPTLVTAADIIAAPIGSDLYIGDGSLAIANFVVDGGTIGGSQYGKGKVGISQTDELVGHNLVVRYFKVDTSHPDGYSASGPKFYADGDALATGDVIAVASTGMGVSTQTGFQVRVWKESKTAPEEPAFEVPEGHIGFTFIGTNNHDFSSYITVPTTIDASTITAHPQGSDIFAVGSTTIAEWSSESAIGGSNFGKGKLTIPQTDLLQDQLLWVRYFKQDASHEDGYSASGPKFSIDGDAIANGEVTQEGPSGFGVGAQTGFKIKIWTTSKSNSDFDGDGVDDSTDAFPSDPNETTDADGNGIGDNADAAGPTESPVLNIAIVGTDVELNWDDSNSFDVHVSSNLSDWTNTNVNTSPHSRELGVSEFFKLSEPEPEPEPEEPEPVDNTDAYLEGSEFSGDQGGMILDGATMINPTFTNANNFGSLVNTIIEFASGVADFSGTDMSGVSIRQESNLSNATFNGADLTGASITQTDLTGADFANANLTNASVTSSVILKNTDFSGADLTSSDFFSTNYNNTNLSGIVGLDPIIFTFIGTNNHDFSSQLEGGLHAGVINQSMPIQDAGSDLYYDDSICVIEWSGAEPIGGSQYGKSKVTIAQTPGFENYNLKVRFFVEDSNNAAGFASAGPVIVIDGAELANGPVTAEADTGHEVSTRTGYSVRVWKEHEPVAGITVADSPDFSAGSNASWPYVITLTTAAEGAASQAQQALGIFVNELPVGGANYSVYKTTANGNDYIAPAQPLVLGDNTITIPAVGFDRAVKIRLSSGDVTIGGLSDNGEVLYSTSVPEPEEGEANPFTLYANPVVSNTDVAAWPNAITLTTAAVGSISQGDQTLSINVLGMDENSSYRIYKTTANGNDYFGPAQALALGNNTITVPSVDFDRAVKIQFSPEFFYFDSLTVNGTTYPEPEPAEPVAGITVADSHDFIAGSNPLWPYVITLTTAAEGAASQAQQALGIFVNELPVGGANYSVYKTTANGNDYIAPAQPLVLGDNTITIPAVGFDRAVKIRLSSGDVAFDSLMVNGITYHGP